MSSQNMLIVSLQVNGNLFPSIKITSSPGIEIKCVPENVLFQHLVVFSLKYK